MLVESEIQEQNACPSQIRQHDSSGIYQQPGGNSVQQFGTPSRAMWCGVLCGVDLWMWCLKKNIHLTAQHLPGVEYVIADAESQSRRHRSDWQLDPAIFRRIAHWFGPIDVDLFATSLATQCPVSAGGQILVQQQRMHSYRTGLISRVMQTLLGT